MKFFIAISCLLAVAAASWPVANVHNHGAVVGAHGVPLEPAANVAARAFHHAAHAEATARNAAAGAWAGDAHGWAGDAHGWAGDAHGYAGDAHGWAGNGYAGNWAGNWAGLGAYAGNYASGHLYAGPQHLAVIGANGVPVDTPANNARRAFHHAAHSEAVARNGDAYGHGAWGYAAHAAPVAWAGHAVPVIGHNGVPVDTPEVAAAKSAHFAAHAAAAHGHGYGHGHGW